ncbi:MAG TPA: zinc-dependent alcohol dehydrogenase family protein [Acidimicrobiales bacterium]|nr:zinc-dependent alcohol dehydrogenase family protein [Acidimicrobiales bacterium]
MSATMTAWAVAEPGPIDTGPLVRIERAVPVPGRGQVRVRVSACGVCRTDLHLAEGDLAPRRRLVVPGHEIVGVVDELGEGCHRFKLGSRVGGAWLARSCGECVFCREGRENLCLAPSFTGWDVDGGYAQYAVFDEEFAYVLPEEFDDVSVAPLLCAGIIGYRALRRTGVRAGGRLGIYGFGGSAHITAQVAIAEGLTVHVMTRSEQARELALALGASSAAGASDPPPEPLDAAILFAPVGTLVPPALAALDRGGTLAVAGIHLSDIPSLNYERHLFQERTLRSVTANTRVDGREFLEIASRIKLRTSVTPYPFEHADQALADLAHERVTGAAVLVDPHGTGGSAPGG